MNDLNVEQPTICVHCSTRQKAHTLQRPDLTQFAIYCGHERVLSIVDTKDAQIVRSREARDITEDEAKEILLGLTEGAENIDILNVSLH